jgi:hypothetical protein
MGGAESPRVARRSARARAVAYTDAGGRATDDPAAAVRGEIVEYDEHGVPATRTRFFLSERELPWLSISEPAFLLWVLVVLMAVWVVIGLVLLLT